MDVYILKDVEGFAFGQKKRKGKLRFRFKVGDGFIEGVNMVYSTSLKVGQTLPFTFFPENADGKQTTDKFDSVSVWSSDPNIFSASLDPMVQNGGFITAGAVGTGTLTVNASVGGKPVTGTATVTLTDAGTGIPDNVTVSIGFNFGTATP